MKVRGPRIFYKQPKPEKITGIIEGRARVDRCWWPWEPRGGRVDGEDEGGGQTALLEQVAFELVIPEVSQLYNPKR